MILTNKVYVYLTEPPVHNALINQGTSEYQRYKKSVEHEFLWEAWETYLSAKEGIRKNICDALDLTYYEKLKVMTVGYKKFKISDYLKYIDEKWCKIYTKTRKQMKAAYYEKWNQEDHITVLGKRINDDQAELTDAKIVITDEEKLQFYIEQMHDSATFYKEEMMKLDKNTDNNKTWTNGTNYFEYIVAEIEKYHYNSEGTAKRERYESSANAREEQQE